MTFDMPRVGFVIVSHEAGPKLQRLIQALDREYDLPPIAIHHDFYQAPIDRNAYRDGILWVDDYVRTGWARWSVVIAGLKAFRLLHEQSDTDWFFLLSAADYPVSSGLKVRRELANTSFDAFVDARVVGKHAASATPRGQFNPKTEHFNTPANHAIKRRFYFSPQWWLPIMRRKPKLRLGKWTYRPPFDGNHPFRDGVECYCGDHWFTANRKAVAALLDPSLLNQRLQHHYRNRPLPEESYYATLLANTPELKICNDNRRFAEWNGGGAHPMTLTSSQLPDMLSSNAFFARKFGDCNVVIEEIDAALAASRHEAIGT